MSAIHTGHSATMGYFSIAPQCIVPWLLRCGYGMQLIADGQFICCRSITYSEYTVILDGELYLARVRNCIDMMAQIIFASFVKFISLCSYLLLIYFKWYCLLCSYSFSFGRYKLYLFLSSIFGYQTASLISDFVYQKYIMFHM
jgi:hypothetical protein